jgi:hypothetical protein
MLENNPRLVSQIHHQAVMVINIGFPSERVLQLNTTSPTGIHNLSEGTGLLQFSITLLCAEVKSRRKQKQTSIIEVIPIRSTNFISIS